MSKLDYKKLYQQQKQQNIAIVSENVKLIAENKLLQKEVEEYFTKAENIEYRYREEVNNNAILVELNNQKQGESEGIMRCFKELLNAK